MNIIQGKDVLKEEWEVLRLYFLQSTVKPNPEDGDIKSADTVLYHDDLLEVEATVKNDQTTKIEKYKDFLGKFFLHV